jgi:hypothetical protein
MYLGLILCLGFILTGFRPCQGLFSRGSWLPVTRGSIFRMKSFLVLTKHLQRGFPTAKRGCRTRRPSTPTRLLVVRLRLSELRGERLPVLRIAEESLIRFVFVREPRTRLRSRSETQVFWKPRIQLMRPFGRGRNTNENHTTK